MAVKEYEVSTIELIMLRRQFYVRRFHGVFFGMLLSLCISFFLLFQIRHLYLEPWDPLYMPTDEQGFPQVMSPLSQPMYSEDKIVEMAQNMVHQSFSLNYVQYRAQLGQVRSMFTSIGWQSYMKNGLELSGTLTQLSASREVTYITSAGSATLVGKGIESGVYTWHVRVPVVVNHVNTKTNELSYLPLTVVIKIARVAPFNHPDGVAIVFVQGSET